MTVCATSEGIAKPMPTLPPEGREDRRVDANHIAAGVEGRAARIATVHRRVDLQEVVVGAGADVTAARRDDAGRDRAAETEGIADRDHPITDAGCLGRPLHGGIGAGLGDLEKGQIGLLVGADHLRRQRRAIVGDERDLRGMLDDMVVGDEVAIRRDEEARPLRLRDMRLDRVRAGAILVAELLEETLQRIARLELRHLLLLAAFAVLALARLVHLHLDGDNRVADMLDHVGERGRIDGDGMIVGGRLTRRRGLGKRQVRRDETAGQSARQRKGARGAHEDASRRQTLTGAGGLVIAHLCLR